jgi:hypothetical protein
MAVTPGLIGVATVAVGGQLCAVRRDDSIVCETDGALREIDLGP